MNEINIREMFKIDDTHSKIRGFVTLFDEDNNLVRSAENMIVLSGRKLMFNALTGGTSLNLKNLSAALISSVNQTTSEDIYTADEIVATIGNSDMSLDIPKSDNDVHIKFTLEFKPTEAGSFSGIILYLEEEQEEQEETEQEETEETEGDEEDTEKTQTLFSRVIFPEYKYTSTKTYKINYYIYF